MASAPLRVAYTVGHRTVHSSLGCFPVASKVGTIPEEQVKDHDALRPFIERPSEIRGRAGPNMRNPICRAPEGNFHIISKQHCTLYLGGGIQCTYYLLGRRTSHARTLRTQK